MRMMGTWCIAASLMATIACGGNMMAVDAGDSGPMDSGPADTGTVDAHPDTHPADVVMANYLNGTCAMPYDLNAHGTPLATGHGVTIHGDNSMAPMSPMTNLVGPSCATNTMTMLSHGGYAVVFQYHMATTGALVVTTDDAATDQTLDTVVWVVDGCGTTAHELACNDDDQNMANSGIQSTAATNHTVMAGATVYIVVAGYTPPVGMGINMGGFTLNVLEVMPNAAGAMCTQMNPFCVDGYSCVMAPMATMGTCNMNGTDNASCNTTAPFCGTGLQCSATAPTASAPGVCQMPIADGGVCTNAHFVCITGDTCVPDTGSTTMGHCKVDGSSGGACRMAAPMCNTGLTCNMMTGLCM